MIAIISTHTRVHKADFFQNGKIVLILLDESIIKVVLRKLLLRKDNYALSLKQVKN